MNPRRILRRARRRGYLAAARWMAEHRMWAALCWRWRRECTKAGRAAVIVDTGWGLPPSDWHFELTWPDPDADAAYRHHLRKWMIEDDGLPLGDALGDASVDGQEDLREFLDTIARLPGIDEMCVFAAVVEVHDR